MTHLEKLNTLVVGDDKNIFAKYTYKHSIFRSKKFGELVDKILLCYLEGKKLIDLIKEIKNPLQRYDLFEIIELMIDAIDNAKRITTISRYRFDDFKLYLEKLDNVNVDEEVLF